MSSVVVIGAQWGDEGKGKIVDYLAQKADAVVRYSGGSNAGHTVVVNDVSYKLRLLPSGVLYSDKTNVLGNGVVINPGVVLHEIADMKAKGISCDNLVISDRAHVVLPYHARLDELQEAALGCNKIGTTKGGIGPCYMDKVARTGIRICDLMEPDTFAEKLKINDTRQGFLRLLAEKGVACLYRTQTGGKTRITFSAPSRGMIGYHGEFLSDTRGTGIMNHVYEGYEPWAGEIVTRSSGSLVADRTGVVTSYALFNLQERGVMFVSPTEEVYEGMIVGENSRENDIDINPCKKKNVSNMRTSSSDEAIRLTPPRILSLEQAIEYINSDELVEVTPEHIRLRKAILDRTIRGRNAKNARKG